MSPDTTFSSKRTDLGFKLVYKKPKFSIDFEAVWRTEDITKRVEIDQNTFQQFDSNNDDHRITGTISYALSSDIALNYTYGKGFNYEFTTENNLISILSLNLGLGGPEKSKFK